MKIKNIISTILSAVSLSISAIAYADSTSENTIFPYPAVPDTLVTPTSRANYLITRFWDNINFHTDIDSRQKMMIEQGFADFISVFAPADTTARRIAMENLVRLSHTTETSANIMDEIAENYLYIPESPVYNEEYFILYLNALLSDGNLDTDSRIRPLFLLSEASKNRTGTKAADFDIILRDGKQSNMLRLASQTTRTALIFVDPDCETCIMTIETLNNDELINRLISEGSLNILAVYGGGDETKWEHAKHEYPANWIAGHSLTDGLTDDIYAVSTFPSIYLLTSDGTILLKNATVERLRTILKSE